MKPPQYPEAAETAQTEEIPAVAPAATCSAFLVLPTDTPADCIAELRAAGYISVITDNPGGVRLIAAESAIGTSDMVMAALRALAMEGATNERKTFVQELYRRLLGREQNADVDAPMRKESK